MNPSRFSGKIAALAISVATLADVAVLMARDLFPQFFPAAAHDALAGFSLTAIAFAYLVYQIAQRPAPWQLAKAVMVAAAFCFWAANQFWSRLPQAALFNDVAIALFVLDLFLVIAEWPPTAPRPALAECEPDARESAGESPARSSKDPIYPRSEEEMKKNCSGTGK